jgi:hypothetical protein
VRRGLGQHDPAGTADRGDHVGVGRRDPVGEQRRAQCRAQPPVSIRSLTSTGTPSSGRCTPRCQRTVDSYAAATASGYADVTSALISGSHASARAVSAASASTGDSSARAYPATSALADIDQIGSPGIDAPQAAHRQEL